MNSTNNNAKAPEAMQQVPGSSQATPPVATFEICCHRFLDEDGLALAELPEFARDQGFLTSLYRAMVLTRIFDEKAVALQRTGRLGTYASSLGQEAVSVGVASAMASDDVLLPSFREHGAQLWRGVSPAELLLYWGGNESGSNFKNCREDFPVCIPVASHCPHAAGVALAFKHRGEARVAVCIAGDGATSKGDFYEAINVAGVWQLPVVFVIANNQWAISVPRASQTAAETLAQKAIAAGIPGEQVDGNDVFAMHDVTRRALERARSDKGPTLIEALTYRLGDHTTADDAARYRDDEVVSAQWKREPIKRLRDHMVTEHAWAREDEETVLAECTRAIESAVHSYCDTSPPAPKAMFDTLFEALPEPLSRQRRNLIGSLESDDV